MYQAFCEMQSNPGKAKSLFIPILQNQAINPIQKPLYTQTFLFLNFELVLLAPRFEMA
ncbi:hypothetical protein WDZ92_33050 [Nostoc sp. NIES-2111]